MNPLKAHHLFHSNSWVAVLLIMWLWACKNQEVGKLSFHTYEIKQLEQQYHFHVVEVDGCHYLLLELDRNNPHEGFGFFGHRGNCPNPIHYTEQKTALNRYPPSSKDILEGTPLHFRHNNPSNK